MEGVCVCVWEGGRKGCWGFVVDATESATRPFVGAELVQRGECLLGNGTHRHGTTLLHRTVVVHQDLVRVVGNDGVNADLRSAQRADRIRVNLKALLLPHRPLHRHLLVLRLRQVHREPRLPLLQRHVLQHLRDPRRQVVHRRLGRQHAQGLQAVDLVGVRLEQTQGCVDVRRGVGGRVEEKLQQDGVQVIALLLAAAGGRAGVEGGVGGAFARLGVAVLECLLEAVELVREDVQSLVVLLQLAVDDCQLGEEEVCVVGLRQRLLHQLHVEHVGRPQELLQAVSDRAHPGLPLLLLQPGLRRQLVHKFQVAVDQGLVHDVLPALLQLAQLRIRQHALKVQGVRRHLVRQNLLQVRKDHPGAHRADGGGVRGRHAPEHRELLLDVAAAALQHPRRKLQDKVAVRAVRPVEALQVGDRTVESKLLVLLHLRALRSLVGRRGERVGLRSTRGLVREAEGPCGAEGPEQRQRPPVETLRPVECDDVRVLARGFLAQDLLAVFEDAAVRLLQEGDHVFLGCEEQAVQQRRVHGRADHAGLGGVELQRVLLLRAGRVRASDVLQQRLELLGGGEAVRHLRQRRGARMRDRPLVLLRRAPRVGHVRGQHREDLDNDARVHPRQLELPHGLDEVLLREQVEPVQHQRPAQLAVRDVARREDA
eukprot:Rhum_TRINITY_DN14790_c30_g1::Rhum_TRINITY_DN14790_c30_g1_i1::g.118208::m.118208